MAEILEFPPVLARIDQNAPNPEGAGVLDEVTRLHAGRLREDPALRSLTEVIRGTSELWEEAVPFIRRRKDFVDSEGYDNASRVFTPLLSGAIYAAPELVDVGLQLSVSQKSERVRKALDRAAEQGLETYVPTLVVGTGPQSQIFNAALQAELPSMELPALTVDRGDHVGGTFRPDEPMNFKLNSRTRPQTGERPKPGTSANINDLTPGIMTAGDTTNEAYIDAEDFGRTVTTNHAFASNICLGMEVESITENIAAEGGQAGDVLAVLRDKMTGRQYAVRTDNVVVLSGLGEGRPEQQFGDQATREIIKEERAAHAAGERAKVLTFEEFMQEMDSDAVEFPLQDRKRIAVVGDGDSAKVAIGKLLGYEPRSDNSTTQLDFVDEIIWYGQEADNTETFLRGNRLRYAQLGLEFDRSISDNRFNRITNIVERALNLRREDERVRVLDSSGISEQDEVYDLVVLANGYKQDGIEAVAEVCKPSLTATDIAQILNPNSGRELRVGDTVRYAPGYTLESIQVVSTSDSGLKVKFTRADRSYGYFETPSDTESLKAYLDPEALGSNRELTPFEFKGIKGYGELDQIASREDQARLVQPGTLLSGVDGDLTHLYRVLEVTDGNPGDINKTLLIQDIQLTGGALYSEGYQPIERELSAAEFINELSKRGFSITTAPYVFSNPQRPERGFTDLDFGPVIKPKKLESIIENDSLESGTVLINSTEPGVFALYEGYDPDRDLYRFIALDRSKQFRFFEERFVSIKTVFRELGFDRIASPPKQILDPDSSLEITQKFETVGAVSQNGNSGPIAMRVKGQPIFVAGPAAKLPVDRELIDLIPDIPENTVSLFSSAERVRDLAGVVASQVYRDSRFIESDKDVLPLSLEDKPEVIIGGATGLEAGNPTVINVKPRERRFEPSLPKVQQEEAVRLTIGALSRDANFRTAPGNSQSITLQVSKAGDDEGLKCTLDDRDVLRLRQTAPATFANYFLGEPLVAEFVRKKLRIHNGINFRLVFDERGLDIRSSEIIPQGSTLGRSALPKIPARSRS